MYGDNACHYCRRNQQFDAHSDEESSRVMIAVSNNNCRLCVQSIQFIVVLPVATKQKMVAVVAASHTYVVMLLFLCHGCALFTVPSIVLQQSM